MKLIEHLEFVIGLLDKKASHSEIKKALLVMHQEIEDYDGHRRFCILLAICSLGFTAETLSYEDCLA
jgi:hypothetical protein